MQGSLDRPPIIVRGTRWRGALALVGSAALVAAILLAIANGVATKTLYASLAFFGLLSVLGLWLVISPARLEIGPDGLRQTQLWRRRRYAWSEVHDFRPATIGLYNKSVGFDFLVDRPRRERFRRLSAAIVGVQGALQPGWEVDPHALANLLNQARERWLEPHAAAVTEITPPPVAAGFAGARMDRKIYAACVTALLAAVVVLWFIPSFGRAAGLGVSFLFIQLYAGRLRDIGHSGWWQITLYAAQILGAVVLATVGGLSLVPVMAAIFALQLIFTATLAAIPGQPGPNRFGPAPGQPTAVAQSEAFR